MSKRGLGKGLDALLSTSSLAREKQHIASHSQALSACLLYTSDAADEE